MKAVIIEHMSDNEGWVWYGVYTNATPEKALRHYEKEMGLDDLDVEPSKIENSNGVLYLKDDDVRAYEITIESL